MIAYTPGTAGVSPASGPHNKVPWLQEFSLPVRSSVPAPSRQDAGAPSVPGSPGTAGVSPASGPHNKVPWLQGFSLPVRSSVPAPSRQDAGAPRCFRN